MYPVSRRNPPPNGSDGPSRGTETPDDDTVGSSAGVGSRDTGSPCPSPRFGAHTHTTLPHPRSLVGDRFVLQVSWTITSAAPLHYRWPCHRSPMNPVMTLLFLTTPLETDTTLAVGLHWDTFASLARGSVRTGRYRPGRYPTALSIFFDVTRPAWCEEETRCESKSSHHPRAVMSVSSRSERNPVSSFRPVWRF